MLGRYVSLDKILHNLSILPANGQLYFANQYIAQNKVLCNTIEHKGVAIKYDSFLMRIVKYLSFLCYIQNPVALNTIL